MKLYELTEQLAGLQDLIDEGALPPEAINDTLEALGGEFNDKAVRICHVIANYNAMMAAVKAEKDRLAAREKSMKANMESLKDYLLVNMQRTGITRIESELFTISLRKPLDVVVIDDEDLIPDEFVRVTRSPNKTEIKNAYKAGEDVPGAHVEKGKPGVTIK